MTIARSVWAAGTRSWEIDGNTLDIGLSLSGLSAPNFSRQPGMLFIYVDGKKFKELPAPRGKTAASVSLKNLPHRAPTNGAP